MLMRASEAADVSHQLNFWGMQVPAVPEVSKGFIGLVSTPITVLELHPAWH